MPRPVQKRSLAQRKQYDHRPGADPADGREKSRGELAFPRVHQIPRFRRAPVPAAPRQDMHDQIDCRECGECCRVGEVELSDRDIEKLARFLGLSEKEFVEKFVMAGADGDRILRRSPAGCVFLQGNECTVYARRARRIASVSRTCCAERDRLQSRDVAVRRSRYLLPNRLQLDGGGQESDEVRKTLRSEKRSHSARDTAGSAMEAARTAWQIRGRFAPRSVLRDKTIEPREAEWHCRPAPARSR